MKYLYLLLIILNSANMHAQIKLSQVKEKYEKMDSLYCMVEVWLKGQEDGSLAMSKYYYQFNRVNKPGLNWSNFRMAMYSNFPTFSRFNPDDFSIQLTQTNIDSLKTYIYTQSELINNDNPRSFDFLAPYMPFSDYFFPVKRLESIMVLENGAYGFKDFHAYHKSQKRKVYINQSSFLVDSIYFENETFSKLVFHYIKYNAELMVNENQIPDCFPININNKFIIETFNQLTISRANSKHKRDSLAQLSPPIKQLSIIDFWFIGCQPCHKKFPLLERLRNEFKDTSLKIIAYSYADNQSKIDMYKQKYNYHFEMKADTNLYNVKYQIKAFPTLLIFNDKGEIIYRSEGFDEGEYDKIKAILKPILN